MADLDIVSNPTVTASKNPRRSLRNQQFSGVLSRVLAALACLSPLASKDMSETGSKRAPEAGSGRTVALVVSSAVLIAAAFAASFLGRFLSYGAVGTDKSTAEMNAVMGLAVYGPFVITLLAIGAGAFLLQRGRSGWVVPLAGVVLLIVNFYSAAALI